MGVKKSHIEQEILNEVTSEVSLEESSEATRPVAKSSSSKLLKVIISSPMHPELNEVVVGLNGKLYQIQLGVPVEIPYEVYQILMDAKIRRDKRLPNGDITTYYVNRFNVQLLSLQP